MSSEAVGDAAQGCCVFLFLICQFGYAWALLQETFLADVDFFFFSFLVSIKYVGLCSAGWTISPHRAVYHVDILYHTGHRGFAAKADTESTIAAAWQFDSIPPEVNTTCNILQSVTVQL